MSTNVADPQQTIAELRRRLGEAEETLRAIRDGEVDALVVRGGTEDAVFTLEGTESYRTFMETMDTGAAALDPDGRVLYANNALCSLAGTTLAEMQGKSLYQVFGGAHGEAIGLLVGQAARSRQTAELRIGSGEDEVILAVSAAPLSIGLSSGYALTFADVTEQVRNATVAELGRAARAVVSSVNEAVVVCDIDGRVTHANAAAHKIYAGDLLGTIFAEAVPLVFHGATGLAQAEQLVATAVGGRSVQGVEATAPDAPGAKDYLISAAPLQLAGGQSSGCVITLVDLSQRKAAEKQQQLLMAELDHRVKNTLAMVLSISSRTMHNEETLEGYQRAFTGRIQALAATHTLLAEKSWRDLSIADVIRAELAPFLGSNADRLNLESVSVAVAPRAAIALGLIFHELATNAAKHGALSNPTGRIDIVGTPDGPGGAMLVEWTERGGPAVREPAQRGFGRTVIGRSLQYAPEGGADMDFRPGGLYCAIRIPPQDIIA